MDFNPFRALKHQPVHDPFMQNNDADYCLQCGFKRRLLKIYNKINSFIEPFRVFTLYLVVLASNYNIALYSSPITVLIAITLLKALKFKRHKEASVGASKSSCSMDLHFFWCIKTLVHPPPIHIKTLMQISAYNVVSRDGSSKFAFKRGAYLQQNQNFNEALQGLGTVSFNPCPQSSPRFYNAPSWFSITCLRQCKAA